ncbi:MAG: hypothetical protein PHS02_00730 [Candidatus ainarchaeum sp.]|nr:hypothetical protein [Candidatus ainarchaeum sp.]
MAAVVRILELESSLKGYASIITGLTGRHVYTTPATILLSDAIGAHDPKRPTHRTEMDNAKSVLDRNGLTVTDALVILALAIDPHVNRLLSGLGINSREMTISGIIPFGGVHIVNIFPNFVKEVLELEAGMGHITTSNVRYLTEQLRMFDSLEIR